MSARAFVEQLEDKLDAEHQRKNTENNADICAQDASNTGGEICNCCCWK